MPFEINVKNCSDCPCHVSDSEMPGHYCGMLDGKHICRSISVPDNSPPWCPLRGGPITLELKE